MAKPSIFEDGEGEGAEADPLAGALDAFQPKGEGEGRGPAPEQIDEITRASKFRSREPAAPKRVAVASWPTVGQPETVNQPSAKRLPMVYRTGRNTTFSVKTTPETVEAFYRIAQAKGWKAGETFERAIELLVAEVEGKGG